MLSVNWFHVTLAPCNELGVDGLHIKAEATFELETEAADEPSRGIDTDDDALFVELGCY
jgi:hypothetical protein